MSYIAYVLNLDRHPDRLAKMAVQLDVQGVDWNRFAAIDGAALTSQELDGMVSRDGPIPRMPVGAQAVTASHLQILRAFLLTDYTHAVVLEDDAVLAPEFARGVQAAIDAGVSGLININRQTPSGDTKRLIVGRRMIAQFDGHRVYDLKGVNYGTAGYLIDRNSAACILENYPHPNMPIDHIMFNPNVSALFSKMSIRQLFPALVKPDDDMISSIQNAVVADSSTLKNKAKRLWAEVSIAPRLLAGIILRRYQILTLEFGGADAQ